MNVKRCARTYLPNLKRNHCPIMFVIISRLDNRSTSQGGVIFPQLELLTRFLCVFLCPNLEFVGNPFFMMLSVALDELYSQWQ